MAISSQASAGYLARLTKNFVDNSALAIKKLKVSLNDEQSEDARKQAHRLKSASANKGAKHLAERCPVFGSATAAKGSRNMDKHLITISEEWTRAIRALAATVEKAT